MLGHHIIRAYFDRVHKQVCKKVTLYLNKDMCAQGTLHPVWNTVRESPQDIIRLSQHKAVIKNVFCKTQ